MGWRERLTSGDSTPVGPVNWLMHNWLLIIFLIPVIRIVLLSSVDGDFSSWAMAARLFFLPTLFLEFGIFILAVANGFSMAKSFTDMKLLPRMLLLGWLAILAASLFYADAVLGLAIRGTLFWIVHLLFFAAVLHLMRLERWNPVRGRLWLVTLPIATALAGLSILIFVYATGLDSNFQWNEDMPGYANLRHTGYIFAPALALGLGHLAAWPAKSPKLHMFLLFINTTLMLWLGSRGPIFGIMIGCAVCFAFFPEMRRLLFWSRTVATIGLGAVASVLLPIPDGPYFGAVQRFWLKGMDTGMTSGRIELWAESLDLISRKPLFGYGAHQFQFVSEKALGMLKHPHQSILQFIFDWGLVGGVIFLAMIGLLVYTAFYASICSASTRLVSAMVVSTLVGFSLVDGVFFYPFPIALAAIFLAWPIVEGHGLDRAAANAA